MPTAFGPIIDRSEGAARMGIFTYKDEHAWGVLIQYRTKRWRCNAVLLLENYRDSVDHVVS